MTSTPTLPTMSHSALCALAADLVINQILRFALKLGEPVEDTLLEYCGYTNRMVTSKLVRNPQCPIDHSRVDLATAPRHLAQCSFAELATAANVQPSDASLSFTVDGFVWIEKAVCQCSEPRPMCRFISTSLKAIGRCKKCRAPMQVQPFYSHRAVPSRLLAACSSI